MKLLDWAIKHSVTYRTAWTHFQKGMIPGAYRLKNGAIIVPDEQPTKADFIVVYARVSSSQNKSNLDSHAKRLTSYANAKGYIVSKVITETGSGLNDNRPKLTKLLQDKKVTKIIVEYKDRLTRFVFNYIKILCAQNNCDIEIINSEDEDKQDVCKILCF